MNIKIHGGVIGNDPKEYGLCTDCANVLIREMSNGAVFVQCTYDHPPSRITEPVVRCTVYRSHNQPDRYDLEKIAWLVNTDKKSGKVGFEPPKKEEE
jgi:hypothetical protein